MFHSESFLPTVTDYWFIHHKVRNDNTWCKMSFSPQAPSANANTPLVPQSPSSAPQSSGCFSCCNPSTTASNSIKTTGNKKPVYTGEIKQNRLKTRNELVARTACCCISLSFLGEAAMPDCCGAGHYLAFCCAELYCQYGFERAVTGPSISFFSLHSRSCLSDFLISQPAVLFD